MAWQSRSGLVSRVVVCIVAAAALTVACTDKETAKRRYFENGSKLLAEGKYQEAIVELRNAIQQDERFGEARQKLAEAYDEAETSERRFRNRSAPRICCPTTTRPSFKPERT